MATATRSIILELDEDEAAAVLGVLWLVDSAPDLESLRAVQYVLEGAGVQRVGYELDGDHAGDSDGVELKAA